MAPPSAKKRKVEGKAPAVPQPPPLPPEVKLPEGTTCRTQVRLMALRTRILTGESTTKKIIAQLVKDTSTASKIATRALELFARTWFDAHGAFPTTVKDTKQKIKWTTLIDQCFKISSDSKRPQAKPQPGWDAFMARWIATGGEHGNINFKGFTQVLTAESQAYITTAMKNYNKIALRDHTIRALKYLYPGHARATYTNAFNGIDCPEFKLLEAGAQALVVQCLEIQAMPCSRGSAEEDKNAASIEASIIFRLSMMESMERVERTREVTDKVTGVKSIVVIQPKLFSLFPHARSSARFISIDDRVAHGILVKAKTETSSTDEKGALKRLFIGISPILSRFERQGFYFPHCVKTNGVQVHFPFEKYKDPMGIVIPVGIVSDYQRKHVRSTDMEDESADPAFEGFEDASRGLFHINAVRIGSCLPRDSVIGMDPGENNIVATSSGKKVTKADFYAWRKPGGATGIDALPLSDDKRQKKAERKGMRQRAKREIEGVQDALSAASMKTHNYDAFQASLRMFHQHAPAVQRYYGSRALRDERFRRVIRQQKGVSRLFAHLDVAVGSSKIIAFGKGYSGRKAQYGQSLPPAPVQMVIRELSKRCRVVMTHENRSSKTCAQDGCGAEVHFDGQRGDERVTTCRNCGKNLERDLNAAVNIASVLLQHSIDGKRPPHLMFGRHGVHLESEA